MSHFVPEQGRFRLNHQKHSNGYVLGKMQPTTYIPSVVPVHSITHTSKDSQSRPSFLSSAVSSFLFFKYGLLRSDIASFIVVSDNPVGLARNCGGNLFNAVIF